MRQWEYFCVLCERTVIEMRPARHTDEYNARKGKRLVCPGCSRRALASEERITPMPTYCATGLHGGAEVIAMRFVPVRGRQTPMCESCWGGGQGPGVIGERPEQRPVPTAPAPVTVSALVGKHKEAAPNPRKQIDWNAVQRDRDAGSTLLQLADKYKVSTATVVNHTNKPSAPARKQPPPVAGVAKILSIDNLIDELNAKRDQLDKAIESLEEVKRLLS